VSLMQPSQIDVLDKPIMDDIPYGSVESGISIYPEVIRMIREGILSHVITTHSGKIIVLSTDHFLRLIELTLKYEVDK